MSFDEVGNVISLKKGEKRMKRKEVRGDGDGEG